MEPADIAKSTASIAAWNLSTCEPLDAAPIHRRAIGLRLLDAELATLGEIRDGHHVRELARHPSDDACPMEVHDHTLC